MATQIPNYQKKYQITTKYPVHKVYQMVVTFSIARPSKIYPSWDFLVWKYTIWQPCLKDGFSRLELSSNSSQIILAGISSITSTGDQSVSFPSALPRSLFSIPRGIDAINNRWAQCFC
jgi:hypothetical protein